MTWQDAGQGPENRKADGQRATSREQAIIRVFLQDRVPHMAGAYDTIHALFTGPALPSGSYLVEVSSTGVIEPVSPPVVSPLATAPAPPQGSLLIKLHDLAQSSKSTSGQSIRPDPAVLYGYIQQLSSFTYVNPNPNFRPRDVRLIRIDNHSIFRDKESSCYVVDVGVAPIREHFKSLPVALWDAFLEVEN